MARMKSAVQNPGLNARFARNQESAATAAAMPKGRAMKKRIEPLASCVLEQRWTHSGVGNQ